MNVVHTLAPYTNFETLQWINLSEASKNALIESVDNDSKDGAFTLSLSHLGGWWRFRYHRSLGNNTLGLFKQDARRPSWQKVYLFLRRFSKATIPLKLILHPFVVDHLAEAHFLKLMDETTVDTWECVDMQHDTLGDLFHEFFTEKNVPLHRRKNFPILVGDTIVKSPCTLPKYL